MDLQPNSTKNTHQGFASILEILFSKKSIEFDNAEKQKTVKNCFPDSPIVYGPKH